MSDYSDEDAQLYSIGDGDEVEKSSALSGSPSGVGGFQNLKLNVRGTHDGDGNGDDALEGATEDDLFLDDDDDVDDALESATTDSIFHVSESMRKHARRIGRRALAAARNGLISNRGHCEILLGPKGDGKSTFLEIMPHVLRQLNISDEFDEGAGSEDGASHRNRVLVASIDLNLSMSENPLQVLADATGIALPQAYLFGNVADVGHEENLKLKAGLQYIGKALHVARSSLVLFVDEYHTVYTSRAVPNKMWQSAMYLLPNTVYADNKMRMFAVLSGSSPWLRGLAFGHAVLSDKEKKKFPLYEGSRLNLNSQRYNAHRYACLADIDEMKTFLREKKMKHDDDSVNEVYFASGGNVGTVSLYQNPEKKLQYYSHIGKHVEKSKTVLLALHAASETQQQYQGSPQPFPWFVPTPVDCIVNVNDKELYEAADHGAITYDDEARLVRFITPALAAYVAELENTSVKWLDPFMRLCLRYPYSTLGEYAEGALRLSLAEHSNGIAYGNGQNAHIKLAVSSRERQSRVAIAQENVITFALSLPFSFLCHSQRQEKSRWRISDLKGLLQFVAISKSYQTTTALTLSFSSARTTTKSQCTVGSSNWAPLSEALGLARRWLTTLLTALARRF